MSTHIQKKNSSRQKLKSYLARVLCCRLVSQPCAVVLLLKIINSQSLFIRPAYKMVREKFILNRFFIRPAYKMVREKSEKQTLIKQNCCHEFLAHGILPHCIRYKKSNLDLLKGLLYEYVSNLRFILWYKSLYYRSNIQETLFVSFSTVFHWGLIYSQKLNCCWNTMPKWA